MKLFKNLFKKKDILALLEQHVNDVQQGKIRKINNECYSSNSYYALRTAVLQLADFVKEKKLTRKKFNDNFLREYILFLEEKKLSKNSIKNNVKQLRICVNRLILDGKIKKFDIPNIVINNDYPTKVFLNDDELKRINEIDLSLTEKYEGVRDLFLIQCYTSLRFSDAVRIARNPKPYIFEQFGHLFFRITTQKTRQNLVIPLKKDVAEILNRRDYKKIRISMPAFNKAIKEICRLAKIDDDVMVSMERGGERVEFVKKKYEMVSSHTGRRTFITNAVLSGVHYSQIQAISGHTTTDSLLKYLHASNLDLAQKSFEHEYFQ